MAIIGNLLVKIGADVGGLKQGLGQAQNMVSGMGGKLGGLGAVGGAVATGGLALAAGAVAGVGAAAVATGASAINMASEIDQAQRDIRTQLGVTEETAQQLGGVVKEVFANNFAGSIPEATQAVIEARQQLGDLSNDELIGATQNALGMADAFDVDMQQSLNGAKVLMEEFGLSQQEAFDMMVGGFQRGLNSSGDFLETVSEYGNLFAENNMTADQFFSVLESGLQGGVLGTDKVGDAFKEFGIRMRETGQFSGNLTQDFERVRDELLEMEDPVERNRRGVELFGTMWEDLGESAILGVDTSQTKLAELAGSTDSLATQYQTWGGLFSGIWKKTLVALEPVSGALLDMANGAMPIVRGAFEAISPWLENFGQWMAAKIPEALTTLQPYLADLKIIFDEFIANLLPVLTQSWNTLYETFTTQIQPALADLFQSFGELMGETSGWDAILKILRTTLGWIPPVVGFIVEALSIWWTVLSFGFQSLSTFLDSLRIMKDVFWGIVDAIKGAIGWVQEFLNQSWDKVGDLMPDWLIPGSPTPFERGLRGISEAIKAMPDLELGASVGGANPALAGAGTGAGIQIGSLTIQANDEAGGRRAATGFIGEMRSRGLM